MFCRKRGVNRNILKVPEIEQKTFDATSNEPWGPHGSLLSEIAAATQNYHENQMVMTVLWKRVQDTGKNWRHVYKALIVMDFLVGHGAERCVDELREHIYQLKLLVGFQYVEPSGKEQGKDQGMNVRLRAESLINLLKDADRIAAVREKAKVSREKYRGMTSTYGSTSSYSPTHSSYGTSAISPNPGSGFSPRDDALAEERRRRYELGDGRVNTDGEPFQEERGERRYMEEKARNGNENGEGSFGGRREDNGSGHQQQQYGDRSESSPVAPTPPRSTFPEEFKRPVSVSKPPERSAVPAVNQPAPGFSSRDDFDDFDPRGSPALQPPGPAPAVDFFSQTSPSFAAQPSFASPGAAANFGPPYAPPPASPEVTYAPNYSPGYGYDATYPPAPVSYSTPSPPTSTPLYSSVPASTPPPAAAPVGVYNPFTPPNQQQQKQQYPQQQQQQPQQQQPQPQHPQQQPQSYSPTGALPAAGAAALAANAPLFNSPNAPPVSVGTPPMSASAAGWGGTPGGAAALPALGVPGSVTPDARPAEKSFEPKSALWADALTKGLVDLNITGGRVEHPLSSLGIQLPTHLSAAQLAAEKRAEQAKAAGSGAAMGRPMGASNGTPGFSKPQPMGAAMGPRSGGTGMGMGVGMGMGTPGSVGGGSPGMTLGGSGGPGGVGGGGYPGGWNPSPPSSYNGSPYSNSGSPAYPPGQPYPPGQYS
eukprot:TRINITY_DN587_c0_g1_i2.p1 TRINITY_DN587_c0_g1~~TRINITY_DN587_c0_g1_i2.p1  ORF type:complete len:706 (-),score=139.97 TRINITY_DN587_c0_g1_i2:392-2509(-)